MLADSFRRPPFSRSVLFDFPYGNLFILFSHFMHIRIGAFWFWNRLPDTICFIRFFLNFKYNLKTKCVLKSIWTLFDIVEIFFQLRLCLKSKQFVTQLNLSQSSSNRSLNNPTTSWRWTQNKSVFILFEELWNNIQLPQMDFCI